MKPCTVILPGGNTDCLIAMPYAKRPYIAHPDLSFASPDEVVNLQEWKDKINVDLDLYIPRGLTSYEVTTDDPNIITVDQTQKFVANSPAPSGVFYLDANFCDYNEIANSLKGGRYGIIYELANGTLFMMQDADNSFKPFPARLSAIGKGIPEPSDIANNFRLFVNHIDYKDFLKGVIVSPDWDLSELQTAMPLGLTLQQTSAYLTGGAGTFGAYITERCGDPKTGLTDSEFEVVRSSFLTSPDVSAVVDDGNGEYTITLQKDVVPANLDEGEWITIRVKNGSDPVTELSGELTIVAP